jgi:hypothetical protein
MVSASEVRCSAPTLVALSQAPQFSLPSQADFSLVSTSDALDSGESGRNGCAAHYRKEKEKAHEIDAYEQS